MRDRCLELLNGYAVLRTSGSENEKWSRKWPCVSNIRAPPFYLGYLYELEARRFLDREIQRKAGP